MRTCRHRGARSRARDAASPPPPPTPSAPFLGTPALLRSGAADGPLAGTTVAVKDLFDLAGVVTGAGNPTFAATHAPTTRDASAVTRLVEAGADVVGKTITDELAWSLAGNNVHYGAPRNVAAPGRRTGGSSSGSAAAVTAGLVDLGLGTDTGGSIRVPASQCGLLGWRPTHGAVPMDGVVPLAPSFDTAGLLAREFTVLRRGAVALLGADTARTTTAFAPQLIGVDEACTVVDDRFRAGVHDLITHDDGEVAPLGVDLAVAADAFRTLQSWEAWRTHGHWIESTAPELAPDIAARFRAAATVTTDDVSRARVVADQVAALVHAATRGACWSCRPPPAPRRRSISSPKTPTRGVRKHSSSRASPASPARPWWSHPCSAATTTSPWGSRSWEHPAPTSRCSTSSPSSSRRAHRRHWNESAAGRRAGAALTSQRPTTRGRRCPDAPR